MDEIPVPNYDLDADYALHKVSQEVRKKAEDRYRKLVEVLTQKFEDKEREKLAEFEKARKEFVDVHVDIIMKEMKD